MSDSLMGPNKVAQFVRQCLREASRDYITTLSGNQVQFGTQEHIDDINETIRNLSRFRDAQRRASAARAAYAAAIRELKKERDAATRHGQRQGYIEEYPDANNYNNGYYAHD